MAGTGVSAWGSVVMGPPPRSAREVGTVETRTVRGAAASVAPRPALRPGVAAPGCVGRPCRCPLSAMPARTQNVEGDRHGIHRAHDAVHRHRGLDPAAQSARSGYLEVLDGHRRILRERLRRRTAGRRSAPRATASSSCSRRPRRRCRGAAEAQRGLEAHPWPGRREVVRVRMGLHTGHAEPSATTGRDRRAPRRADRRRRRTVARWCCQHATADLARAACREGAVLRDLGRAPAQGHPRPRSISTSWDVTGSGRLPLAAQPRDARASLPTPRPAGRPRGRDRRRSTRCSVRPGARLVTLTGPGGPARRGWPSRSPRSGSAGMRRRVLRRAGGDLRSERGVVLATAAALHLREVPTGRSPRSWAIGSASATCCWFSTTSSICSKPRRSSPACSLPHPACGSS